MTETIHALLGGFAVALTPVNLLWALAGVTLGTFVGVLPGLGPALTVALLLPATYGLDPAAAFIMFAGIYYGGMYGGSTTSILLNTPGESASIMTALEGHLMARAGRGGPALCTAAIGSFVAGTLATLALTFLAPLMASAALRFGPPEYFALTVLAFTAVSAVLGGSILRGLVSLFFGLSLGLVGIDALTGQTRFTAGIPQFLDGIDVVLVVVGLFAVGETLYMVSHRFDEDFVPIRGSRLDVTTRLGPLVETVAARHADWISPRGAARRWRRDSHVPVLCRRTPSHEAPGGIRSRRNRRRGGTRGRQQCIGSRHAGAAADAGAADLRDRGRAVGRVSAVRPSARAACSSSTSHSSCGD